MREGGISVLFMAGLIGFSGAPAIAQQAAPTSVAEAVDTSKRWSLRVEPSVWFAGPAGRVQMPTQGTSNTVTSGDVGPLSLVDGNLERFELGDLEIDTPEASLSAEVHLGRGNWRFALRGMSFSGDEDTTAIGTGAVDSFSYQTGDDIETSLDYAQVEFEVGYSLVKRDLQPYQNGHKLHTNLEAIGGVRYYDIDWDIQNVTSGSASATAEEMFLEPLAGARLTMELYEQFDIDVQLTAGWVPGGDNSTLSVDVMVGGVWRPVEHFGVQFGYRLTGFDLGSEDADEDFQWRGSMAGVYLGAVVQF